MRRCFVPLVLTAVITLAACGSGSSNPTTSATTQTTNANALSSPTYEKAGPNPSKSAKMVCQKEARADIADNLGVKETRVTPPVWVRARHLYSCTYVYPNGRFTLNVKELVSEKTTTAYFEAVKRKYGTIQELIGLGQGAWVLKNHDVVVRKDYKVLLVDVQGLPPKFGASMDPSDVATTVSAAIMGCWVGD